MKKLAIALLAAVCLPGMVLANQNPFEDNAPAVKLSGQVAETGKNASLEAAPTVDGSFKNNKIFKPVAQGWTLDQAFNAIKNGKGDSLAKARYVWANDDAWYCRWKMLSEAKKTIDCTYYIVDKDVFGQAFLGLLMRKAQEGVKIRLMIDGRIYRSGYMKGMPDCFQELSGVPNVQIKIFNSVSKSLLHALTDFQGLFASNHDKIIITDSKTCIIGGRNIGPDYYAGKGEYSCVYRDSDVLMEGEHIAPALKNAFDAEWVGLRNSLVKPDWINWKSQKDRLQIAALIMDRYMVGKGLLNPAKLTNWTKAQKAIVTELNEQLSKFKGISAFASYQLWTSENDALVPVKIIDKSSRLGKLNDITPCLIAFIDASKEEVLIQNPYVVITEEAYAALVRASKRGVKITIHSNSAASTDSLFPQAFLQNEWKQMMVDMPTLRLLVAPSVNERLHSKTFVFDQKITVVGSYNMDPLSEDKNSEIIAAINDADFGRSTYERIQKDMDPVIEYKIRITKEGKVEKVFGPEDHLSPEIQKKLKYYTKLKWIRPVI